MGLIYIMQVYLVGGAVRDQLLNIEVKDRDWIVVGATPQQLLQKGYIQVGKTFPVFIDPQYKEEYALARTEKKSGTGYTGFICNFDPTVTLEQDLIRRDLTINAIAQDQQGNLYDPYGGIKDLNLGILRHISSSFIEDPLRVLRVARFAARYFYLNFKIAPETIELMTQIALQGELQHLSAERIWLETEKALQTQNPEIYFEILYKIGALKQLLSKLSNLCVFSSHNLSDSHSRMNSFSRIMLALQNATKLTGNYSSQSKNAIRFSAICCALKDILTFKDNNYYKSEEKGNILIKSLCETLKIPHYIKDLACLSCKYYNLINKVFQLSPEEVLRLFSELDCWRRPERFKELLLVCTANQKGLEGKKMYYPQADFIFQLYQSTLEINIKKIIADGFQKEEIKKELTRQRLYMVQQTYKNFLHNRNMN